MSKKEKKHLEEYFMKRDRIHEAKELTSKEKGYLLHRLHKKYYPKTDPRNEKIFAEDLGYLKKL